MLLFGHNVTENSNKEMGKRNGSGQNEPRIDADNRPPLVLSQNLLWLQIEGDRAMKIAALIVVLFFAPALACAQGPKPCEVLKSEIAKKLDANGAKAYTLEIVAKDKDAEGKVVGSCEGGTKKIIYFKTATPPKTPAPAAKKP
jgi:hypothetical protein